VSDRRVLIDAVAVEERAASLGKRSIEKSSKVAGLELTVAMMDLTTLEGNDTPGRVRQLCEKACVPLESDRTVGPCAAVCVYPNFVSVAKEVLRGSGVKVASVATAFPSGQFPLAVKLSDVRSAVEAGADEIDMVIDRGAMLVGDYAKVFDEIAATKEACGGALLKVILETGELGTYDTVRRASEIAMAAGGDFIKTSTGKIQPAATPAVTLVMLEAIRDHYAATGRKVGMKPAGGIRTAKQALHYLVLVKETLGNGWLSPKLFRFGASSLLNDVLAQLEKERAGNDVECKHPQYKLAEISEASAEDVGNAVAAAREAYEKTWSEMRVANRAKYMFRVARMIQDKAREFAVVQAMDGGEPIDESRDFELPLAAAHFFYHAGWADKLELAFHGRSARPLGVVAAIMAADFPLLTAARHVAPALACGNTVVLKPAETAPRAALLLAKIIEEAGLPQGVVNVVTGGGEVGAALAAHPGVDQITFTGSAKVGKYIQRALAGTGKRRTFEFEGSGASIVFADAPIDQAVEGIVRVLYFHQGWICEGGPRLLVEESVHDLVLRKLKDRMATLRVAISTFRTPEEAVEKANSTAGDFSASVWTNKGSKFFWMAQRLKAKTVWGNTCNKFAPSPHSLSAYTEVV